MSEWKQDGLWNESDEPGGGVPSEETEVHFDLDACERDHSTAAGDEAITPGGGRRGFDAGDPSTWSGGRTWGDIAGLSAMKVMPDYSRMLDRFLGFQRQSVAAMVSSALAQWKPQVPAWRSIAEQVIENQARVARQSTENAITSFLPQQRLAADIVLTGVKPFLGGFDTVAFKTGITINTGFESFSRQMLRQLEGLAMPALGGMSALRVPALAHIAANVTGLGIGMDEMLRIFAATTAPFDPDTFALQGVSALLRNVPSGASVLRGDLLDATASAPDDAEPSLRDAARAGAALIRAQRPDLSDDPETVHLLATLLQTSVLAVMTWVAVVHPAVLQHLGTALLVWQSSQWARHRGTGLILPTKNENEEN